MRAIKTSLIAVCVILFSSSLIAQDNEKKTADKMYDKLGYKEAIKMYKSSDENLSIGDMARMANAYRLNGDYENARTWYSQVVERSDKASYRLYYAQALQASGNYGEAKAQFLKYDELVSAEGEGGDNRGKILAAACDRVQDFSNLSGVMVENVGSINSEKLEFSPTFYRNGIVFASTRPASLGTAKDAWIDDNFMTLFYASRNADGSLGEPVEFSNKINTKYHEGPVTFNRGGDAIYFTRNDFNKGKRHKNSKGTTTLNIYSADKIEGEWANVQELPFNSDERTTCHPTLAPDGRKLYFSSDRPGGYGGMDLYMSKMTGGKWSSPMNLGPEVNTKGNEIFPFIHDDGTLYFASNGLAGLGGLDIFSAVGPTDTTWTAVQNLGKPYNSSKDDFGFILNVTGTEGYFSSSRDGGYGGDDIYSFISPKGMSKSAMKVRLTTNVCVYDKETNKRIEGAKVTIKEKMANGAIIGGEDDLTIKLTPIGDNEYVVNLTPKGGQSADKGDFYTGPKGEFEYVMDPNKEYIFEVSKDGYKYAEQSYLTEGFGVSQNLEFCIPVEKETCLALAGVVINQKYNNRLAGAKVILTNLCTGESVEAESGEQGEFSFCLDCGCDYVLQGEKINFMGDKDNVSTINIDCEKALSASLALSPTVGFVGNPNFDPSKYATSTRPSTGGVIGSTTTTTTGSYPSTGTTYSGTTSGTTTSSSGISGRIIELKKIYYDFNKSFIRSGAAIDLDDLARLMNEYPSMSVQLSSHTDSRGTDVYNNDLSTRRAQAARQYLVGKGISTSRIVAIGYGESQLRNSCANGVDCTEAEHQDNRRTEVTITSFDQADFIKVQYIDNPPEKVDPARIGRKFEWE